MIEEHAIVVELRGRVAIVTTEKGSECDGCGSKSMCQPSDDKSMMVTADNPVGASVGDKVIISVGAATVLKAGVMLYLIPLLAFIAGVVAGQELGPRVLAGLNKDLVSAALGFLFLIFAFLGIRAYSKKAEQKYRPTIIRVIGQPAS